MAKNVLKLIPKSRLLRQESQEMDSVKFQRNNHADKAIDILFMGMNHWMNLDRFRRDRARAKRYTYGDQWQDRVPNPDTGGTQSEEDYIRQQGSIPLKNNLIRRLTNNVLGVFLNQNKHPICKARDRAEQEDSETMSQALECNWELNGMSELNAMSFEEFLISGMVVHRKGYEWRGDKADCWTDYVNPNYFFIDGNIRRSDGKDATVIGEIHDVTFFELCNKFAHNADDYFRLKRLYPACTNRELIGSLAEEFGYSRLYSYDYFIPHDPNLCRVIEIWTKESKPRYRCIDYLEGSMFKIEVSDYDELVRKVNERRKAEGERLGYSADEVPLIEAEWCIDTYWYYRFMTPTGDILDEGETPYDHKEHPYVVKFYPFIDGEIHSFVSDVLDQQRYVNRLITLYDWIMRSSVKGCVFAPDDCLPDGVSWDDFAEQVTKVGGIVRYKVKPHGQVPHQVASNSTNIGISDLLQLELKLFEDISGVNGALQGKPGYSQTSGLLYAQQTQNATTSLSRLLQTFSAFVCECAKKDVKNIQQYYTTERYIDIAGRSTTRLYVPSKQQNVDYDIKIAEVATSAELRSAANEFLIEIWRARQISLQQLLECGDFPFADRLLESLKQQPQEAPPMNGAQPDAEQMTAAQQEPQMPTPYDRLDAARKQLQATSKGEKISPQVVQMQRMIRHAAAS